MDSENQTEMFAGGGGGGGSSSGGHIASNSLFSNADLRVLDLISEGQIGGLVNGAKSIFFDDVPLQNSSGSYNFDGIEVDWVNGTADQKIISGFGDVSMPQSVGTEVKKELPVTVAIPNNNADRVRVVVSLPSLYSSDDKGNINETSVRIRFELSTDGYGYFSNLGEYEISGKQNSEYQRSYEFSLPQKNSWGGKPSQWLLRMTRLSEDSHERYSARTILDTIFVINNSWYNYPYSAVVGIRANAKNLSSIPTRSYLIDGLIIKIPSNYNPSSNTYSGVWDGTFKMAVSSNPAWILYALLTNERWGLGCFIKPEQVNKAKLYEIGRYCDEMVDDGYGGKEKRFTINTQIQERSDAYRLISDIAAVFRGMAFWAGGRADFTCDKPTEPSMLYTPSNVVGGTFTYQGSSRNDRHSVALVTWNDPDQNYKQVVEYVEDAELIAKYGIRQAELTAFGCTSRGQAIRAGKWILYTESYESDVVQFNVGLDSALVLPGDVIKIQDPSYSGKRMGGRLVEVGANYAVLDSEIELWSNNNTVISIRMPDGSFVSRDVIVPRSNTYKYIEWNDPLPELPTANAIWLMTENTTECITARVVNIQQADDKNVFTITAVFHEPQKFDLIEKGIKIDSGGATNDPYDIGTPRNPNVEEITTSLGLGYISSILRITWQSGKANTSYEIQWRRETNNETDWHTVQTQSKYIDLTDVQNGTYHFILRGVGIMGNKSGEVEFYYIANGQYVTPLDVTDFQVIKRPSYLEVKWNPVEGASSYEVRCGSTWDNGEVLIENFAGTSFVHYQYEAGTYYYHIRSISASGDYSTNVTTYKLVLTAPKVPEDLNAVVHQNRIDFAWKANTEDDLSHYELREGTSWESSVKVAESKVSQMTVPNGTDTARKFWLKAVALPKIYSDQAAWILVNIKTDENRNIILEQNARTFQWSADRIHMEVKGDDLVMENARKRSEYIAQMVLPGKITAQNTFSTSVTVTVADGEDTEKWETANWSWESDEAKRSWRLSGDTDTVTYENQIARHIGLNREDLDGISLEEHLDSELGKSPSSYTGISFDWGRYTQGLNITDVTAITWDGNFINTSYAKDFRLSFWVKTKKADPNMVYNLFCMGNENDDLTISYTSEDRTYRLTSKFGETLPIEAPMAEGDHVFFGISQQKNVRTFVVGILGGGINIQTGYYEPIGNIKFVKLGTDAF